MTMLQHATAAEYVSDCADGSGSPNLELHILLQVGRRSPLTVGLDTAS